MGKRLLYMLLGVLGGLMTLSSGVFVNAQTQTTTNDTVVQNDSTTTEGEEEISLTQQIADIVQFLTGFFSRARIMLAIIAGKLMSNELVYGSFMNFDGFLRQMRQLTRNFANFGLGFLFLFMVIKFFFEQTASGKEVAKKIGYFVIAGVLIQSSWFLLGALLDISTIATVAVSSMPNAVLQEMPDYQKTIYQLSTDISKEYHYTTSDSQEQPTLEPQGGTRDGSSDDLLDTLTPRQDSVSGPLVFMGVSILRFQDNLSKGIDSPDDISLTELPKFFATIVIKFGIVIMYSIALIFLIILNLFRIFYLWFFIVLAPLIILFKVMKQVNMDFGVDGEIEKQVGIDFNGLLRMVFAPVVYVAFLGLMLILIIALYQGVIGTGNGTTDPCLLGSGICLNNTSSGSELQVNDYTIAIEGELMSEKSGIKHTLPYLIITLLVIGLMRVLVKMASSMSSFGTAKGVVDKVSDTATKLAGSAQVIPLPGGGSIGLNALQGSRTGDKLRTAMANNLEKSGFDFGGARDDYQRKLDGFLGLGSSLTRRNTDRLSELSSNKKSKPDEFFDYVKGKDMDISLSLKDTPQRSGFLTNRVKTNSEYVMKEIKKDQGVSFDQTNEIDKKTFTLDSYYKKNPIKGRAVLQYLDKKLGGKGDIKTYKDFSVKKYNP